jgi:chemotaxis protein MotB
MATLLPKPNGKFTKGQDDHVDAWLMSYADLITLLFIFFAIFFSASLTKHNEITALTRGEPEHPYVKPHYGPLALGTAFDEMYTGVMGAVVAHNVDPYVAVEKTSHSLSIDLSSLKFFIPGTADIPSEQLPALKNVAQALKSSDLSNTTIEVEGYTDDSPLENSPYANSWELAAMRATRVVGILINEGIDPTHLRAMSYANNRPVVPNDDYQGKPIPENRSRNQRVVIKVEAVAVPELHATLY